MARRLRRKAWHYLLLAIQYCNLTPTAYDVDDNHTHRKSMKDFSYSVWFALLYPTKLYLLFNLSSRYRWAVGYQISDLRMAFISDWRKSILNWETLLTCSIFIFSVQTLSLSFPSPRYVSSNRWWTNISNLINLKFVRNCIQEDFNRQLHTNFCMLWNPMVNFLEIIHRTLIH